MRKIIFIFILIGIVSYFFYKPEVLNYEDKSLLNTYGILFSQEEWGQKLIPSETPHIWDVQVKNIIVEENIYDGDFMCGNTKANFTRYKYNIVLSLIGKGERTSVVDCGDYYFILNNNDSVSKLFGPFDLVK